MSRRPPPYQETSRAVRPVVATTSRGVGSFSPFLRGPMGRPLALDLRGGLVQLGIGVEPADQGQMAAVPVGEAGQGMRPVAAAAGEDEPAAGGPMDQDGQQLPHQLAGRLVPTAMFTVPLGGPIQGHQHGQRPGARREGELDQHGQDDPLVPPPPGGIAVRRADRVAVAALAVDLRAAVLIDGIVAGQRDGLAGGDAAKDGAGQGVGQGPGGPLPPGEDAVVAGGMAGGQAAGGAKQVGDGAPAGVQDGGGHEGEETLEGRPGEGVGHRLDQRSNEFG